VRVRKLNWQICVGESFFLHISIFSQSTFVPPSIVVETTAARNSQADPKFQRKDIYCFARKNNLTNNK